MAPNSAEETPNQRPRFWEARRPLARKPYVVTGAVLMLLKYGVEFAFIRQLTGRTYTPLDFINPLMNSRRMFLNGAPEWFGTTWLLWTLPFVTIAVIFSVRRAIDAGWSPWLGLVILVPFVNLLLMFTLAWVPSARERRTPHWPAGPLPSEPNSAIVSDESSSMTRPAAPFAAAMSGVAAATLYGLAVILLTVYAFDSYGAALFFGTPLVAGAFAAYIYNLSDSQGLSATIGVSLLPVLCVGLVLLFVALEGIVCLIMAAPIMLSLAIVGGLIGKTIADRQRQVHNGRRQFIGCLIALPLMAWGETRLPHGYEYAVVSSVDIAAPPETVWKCVVDFPPLTSPEPWLFRMGIAGPRSARIAGSGVGAIRRCEFTTGAFVEPITVWDEPRRLAFDVTEQPEPMFELSPYRDIHPPHLRGAFRSTRGEFVLEPLDGGRTRLVGRTWYRLEMAPHMYWTAWTDWIVHRIHLRVLEHVKSLAEAD